MLLNKFFFIIISSIAMICVQINAATVINGTRFVYLENEKEVTVKITNKGLSPVLIQSWFDIGDINEKPDSINVPFVLTPPINRLNSEKSQTVRVRFTGGSLPSDRESLFWLNVLEIPQSNNGIGDNQLQFAFRSRVKFFYRPLSLKDNSIQSAESLEWFIKNGKLVVENKSGFYITLISVTNLNSNKTNLTEAPMISPFGEFEFTIKDLEAKLGDEISYEYINDWGALKSISKKVKTK